MHRPDARTIYARLTTYVLGAVVLLAAGLSAIATDLVRLMTAPEFWRASIVIPATAVGVVAQAAYQVTAIGLNITKQAKYFPIATTIAAAVSIVGNLIVMPRYGMLGAAYMNAISYTALTIAAGGFAYRVYPVRYEWRRLGLIAGAGLVSYLAATLAVPVLKSALVGLLVRGSLVVAIYPLILLATGCIEPSERERLIGLFASMRKARPEPVMTEETNEMGGEILTGSVEYLGPVNNAAGTTEAAPKSPKP
jgi:O-antigen/teichoic acid export membrane protein